jgi:hypothetical protein
VSLSYSDKYFLVVYVDKDDTCIRVYNLKDAIAHGKNKTTTDLPYV